MMDGDKWKRLRLHGMLQTYWHERLKPRSVGVELEVPARFRLSRNGYGARARKAMGSMFGEDAISVFVHDEESIAGRRGVILTGGTDQAPQQIIRRGVSDIRCECVEVVDRIQFVPGGEQRFDWGLVFRDGAEWIDLRIGAVGDFAEAEPYWSRVVKGVHVLPEGSATNARAEGIQFWRSSRACMSKREKNRLVKVLESLPDRLEYLREPILAIADQNQDLLGSGEADTTALGHAIGKRAISDGPGFAATQAADLETWLKARSTPEDAWARPAWFVRAFLTGYDIFGEDRPH